MAERIFDLKIRVKADDDASGTLGFIESNLQKLGRIALAGVAAIGTAAVIAGGHAIALGSDAEEMMGKFNTVFGDFAGQSISDLDAMAEAMNRNKYELWGFAAAFQDTFVPLGFARGEAADMSETLTQLAVDLASFNNLAESDVAAALQSALVGNHETVRQFGVIITQAALDAELMRMGIEGGTEAATEQEKVMARLNLILAGTTDAQGDAERTAGSWANQMRGLKATLAENATELGAKLLPVLTPLLGKVSELASLYLPMLIDAFETYLLPILTTASDLFLHFSSWLEKGTPLLGALSMAIWETFPPEVAEPLLELVGNLGHLSGALQGLTGDARLFEDTPKWAVDIGHLAEQIHGLVEPIATWITQNVSLNDILIGLGIAVASVVIPALISVLTTIGPIILVFLLVVAAVALLRAAWENDFLGIRTSFQETWKRLQSAFKMIREWFERTMPPLIERLRQVWEEDLQPAIETFGQIIEEDIMPLIGGDGMQSDLSGLEVLLTILTGGLNIAVEAFSRMARGVRTTVDAVKDVIDWLQRLNDKLGGVSLPWWLTPGSPTPFEMGLRGISGAVRDLSRVQLPHLQQNLGGMGVGGPASAGLAGGNVTTIQSLQVIFQGNAPRTPQEGEQAAYHFVNGLRAQGVEI